MTETPKRPNKVWPFLLFLVVYILILVSNLVVNDVGWPATIACILLLPTILFVDGCLRFLAWCLMSENDDA